MATKIGVCEKSPALETTGTKGLVLQSYAICFWKKMVAPEFGFFEKKWAA
jgi:hypothetical protein